MPVNRKRVSLTEAEIAKVREFAVLNGSGSSSSVVREWIENFLKHGSDYVAPNMVELQVVIDPEIAAAAETKARDEYGCSIRDIVRFEISEIDRL